MVKERVSDGGRGNEVGLMVRVSGEGEMGLMVMVSGDGEMG